jgi:hypothetical protein
MVNCVTGKPPVNDEAVKSIVAEPSPTVTSVMVGAPGGADGVTGGEADEGAETPTALVAVAVKV